MMTLNRVGLLLLFGTERDRLLETTGVKGCRAIATVARKLHALEPGTRGSTRHSCSCVCSHSRDFASSCDRPRSKNRDAKCAVSFHGHGRS